MNKEELYAPRAPESWMSVSPAGAVYYSLQGHGRRLGIFPSGNQESPTLLAAGICVAVPLSAEDKTECEH